MASHASRSRCRYTLNEKMPSPAEGIVRFSVVRRRDRVPFYADFEVTKEGSEEAGKLTVSDRQLAITVAQRADYCRPKCSSRSHSPTTAILPYIVIC